MPRKTELGRNFNPTGEVEDEPTGREFNFLDIKRFISLKKFDHGQEGMVYSARVEMKDKREGWVVIKKFFGKIHSLEEQKEKCIFTSRYAEIFRREKLPVLPMVKSVLTEKGLISPDEKTWWQKITKSETSLKPPYVIMTALLPQYSKIKKVLNFDGVINNVEKEDLGNLMRLTRGMFADLAKIHHLGLACGHTQSGVSHPVDYLWLFTQDNDGDLKRWLVDISNLKKINDEGIFTSSQKSADRDELTEYVSGVTDFRFARLCARSYDLHTQLLNETPIQDL